jgi:hypothetical protein
MSTREMRPPEEAQPEIPAKASKTSLTVVATPPCGVGEKAQNQSKPSQTERFLNFVIGKCEVFPASDGRLYGVLSSQPHIAWPISGDSGLVSELALKFHAESLEWPTTKCRAEAVDYLSIRAARACVRPVALRSAWSSDSGELWLDLGDPDATVFAVNSTGWRKVENPPVVFRRVPTMASMEISSKHVDRDEALALLKTLVPVQDADMPLLLALLLVTWFDGAPQPILLWSGPRDSGKTMAARFLLSVIDPTTHTRGGGLPPNEQAWKAQANTAKVVLVDNAGHITPAMSDILCRVSTGGEVTTRAFYTNDTAHVTDLRIPVWLTSVDAGVLREDLATRVVKIELTPLDSGVRLAETELVRRQEEARPVITRFLLDLLVEVLDWLPEQPTGGLKTRMGDFEQIVRCVDDILGTRGTDRLGALALELGEDVLASDPVAQALIAGTGYRRRAQDYPYEDDKVDLLGEWTPVGLLKALIHHASEQVTRSQTWPRSAGVLTSHLNRIAPTLEQVHGIRVTTGLRVGKQRKRLTRIELVGDATTASTATC